jgi:hypothetical protein
MGNFYRFTKENGKWKYNKWNELCGQVLGKWMHLTAMYSHWYRQINNLNEHSTTLVG